MKNLKTSWPLEAKLQVEEKELVGKRIQMKYQKGWQDLPNNITLSDINYDVDEVEFKSDKIKIEFRSTPGENFGKKDDIDPIEDITVIFTTFWHLDNANKPNFAVGAVLENIQPQSREAHIRVISRCKNENRCACNITGITSLKMTSPPDYIVGKVSKLNFDLVLKNSGDESALNTKVRFYSSIINPTNNANTKPKGDRIFEVKAGTDSSITEGSTEEKSIWKWIINPGKSRITTSSFKFQLDDRVNFPEQGSPPEEFKVEVEAWCCNSGNCKSDVFNHTVDPALSFEYKSEVKWEKVNTDEGKQTVEFDDDSRNVPFSQTFMITNKGPSPTVEKTQLKIFIPETKLVKSQNVQIENWKGERENCTKELPRRIPLSMKCEGAKEVISCQGSCSVCTSCIPYTCNLKSDWKKRKSYKINVPMSFSATNAEHNAYAVCVYAKVEGIFSIRGHSQTM